MNIKTIAAQQLEFTNDFQYRYNINAFGRISFAVDHDGSKLMIHSAP